METMDMCVPMGAVFRGATRHVVARHGFPLDSWSNGISCCTLHIGEGDGRCGLRLSPARRDS